MALPHVWLWTTLLALVLMWTIFHVSKKRRKNTRKIADAATVEERTDGAADVIIVGAGVGGSAFAYALAKDGRRVHVIERDMREPERIMGEVMQPGGRFMLAKLGLEDCLEEIDAQNVTGLAVYKDGKEAVLPFPVENNNFPYEPSARSFHNGRFVQRLRQKASSLPNNGEHPANVFSQVLIATTDEAREGMRQGCFNYLCSGDFRTSGIMALLGGMNPRPLTLVHLVAITVTSMGHMLSPFPSPRRFWHSLSLFADYSFGEEK